MAELLGMSNAAWRRQPSGRVGIQHHHTLLQSANQNYVIWTPGLTATHVGAMPAASQMGNSYEFDGADDYSYITKSWIDSANVTAFVLFVAKTASSTAQIKGVIDHKNLGDGPPAQSPLNFSWNHTNSNFQLAWAAHNTTFWTPCKYISTLAAGTPHFISATRTSNVSLRIYLNGLFNNSATLASTDVVTGATNIFFGSGANTNFTPSSYFDGLIALVGYIKGIAHDDAWHREIGANPWQLFRPAPSRFILIPSAGGVLSLIVASSNHSHSADPLLLTQAHVLSLAESLHTQAADSPLLSQAYALTLAAAAHAQSVDTVALTQAHTITAQDGLHSQSVDSPALIQAHVLTLTDATHSQAADGVVLSVAGSILVADGQHTQAADAPALTQANTLSLQAASHSQTADGSLALTQGYVLATADALHSQTTDAATLSTELNLILADSLHTQTADGLGLTQAHVLNLADSLHNQTAESVAMGQGYSLIVGDGLHSHTADSPTISIAFVLSVLDAVHSQSADALNLATHVTLIVSDALHTQLAGAAVESTLTPAGRVFVVHAEDRVFIVMREDRVFSVVS